MQGSEAQRRRLEEALASLGREDVGVGAVEDLGAGRLRVTFVRGHFTHTAELEARALEEPQRAKAALVAALRKLSKEIEAEHIERAQR